MAPKNTKPKGRDRRHRSSSIVLWVLVSVAVLVCAGLFTIAPYMMTGSENDVTIRVPKDATMDHVTDTLNKYYPEDYTKKVLNMMTILGFDPVKRHGLYTIPKGATPFATARRLSRGAQTPVKLIVNAFRSVPYMGERADLKMEFSKDDFMQVVTDPEFLAQYDLTPETAMALFLDDTYEVYWTASARETLEKIGQNYLNFWSEGRRQAAADLQLTPAEVMILASIVDEETNQVLEKGRIGRLYINRLDKGMKLQADPTVRFALNDWTIKRVTNDHLKVESPYNTYINYGLPPGPIRTTSRKTVEEILNSNPSKDIFMCAREDFSGFHNFAPTYEEHLENARRYQKALDERGIK